MPGITGIISPDASIACLGTADAMVEAMRHETFYRTGSLREARCGVAAGWAVHADSYADCNPIWNEAGDVCLIQAGEEFSAPDRIDALRSAGHRFGTDDASYLVHLYEQLGPAFVDELNGTLSGLLIDLRQGLCVLFNDRFGLSRLYVHETPDAVHFSSEAKSILRVLPETRALDTNGLAEFAACGCALQGRTLFSRISLVPPASKWLFVHGRLVRKETYFDPATWEQLPRLAPADFYAELKATFPAILRKYFRGRAPIGMSLTGGLDGRMIMACSGQAPGALPCYTFAGTYRDCTDVSLARQVARDCGQSHALIMVDDSFLKRFGEWAERAVYVSDGSMDVTGSVELFANASARQIAPVRMTGNYGSEILRSNVAFKAAPLNKALFSPEFVAAGRTASATYDVEAGVRDLSLITTKQVPWHHPSRLSVELSQLTMRSPYLDNAVVKLAYQAPLGEESSKAPALRFVADARATLGRIPTDRGLMHRPVPALTALRHVWQEFAFRSEYAYDYGMPQWLAPIDRALRPLRPERLFLGRHKFYHFRVWYRDRLGAYLKEVLLDPRSLSRPHLAPGGLKTLLAEHLAGRRNHTAALHQALSIELVHRQLIERSW